MGMELQKFSFFWQIFCCIFPVVAHCIPPRNVLSKVWLTDKILQQGISLAKCFIVNLMQILLGTPLSDWEMTHP